jgi:hypothetical protein
MMVSHAPRRKGDAIARAGRFLPDRGPARAYSAALAIAALCSTGAA